MANLSVSQLTFLSTPFRLLIVSLSGNFEGVAEMSGADEDLWGDEEDDAMLAMMVNPDQVLSF